MIENALPAFTPLTEAAERYEVPVEALIQAVEGNILQAVRIGEIVAVSNEGVITLALQSKIQVSGDELVSISEVARRLEMPVGTIGQWQKYGWLPAMASGPRGAKLVSWQRAAMLGELHKARNGRGRRLIPQGKEVMELVAK